MAYVTRLMVVACCLLGLVGLSPLHAAEVDWTSVKGGVRYQLLGTYTQEQLNEILTTELKAFSTKSATVSFPPVTNAVRLYRVRYPSVVPEQGNRPVELSGLVAVPDTKGTQFPLVSYQRGTIFSRDEVPSVFDKSAETRLMVAHLAGNGYIVIGADLIGKGLSNEGEAYTVKEVTVQACMDMLDAARFVLANLGITSTQLFLSGWSQGALDTLYFRDRLEAQGVTVAAAASASTPSDLYLLCSRWINKPTALDANWLVGSMALLVHSYERYAQLPGLSAAAIKPAYQQTARDFYLNKIGWAEAAKVFPVSVKEFLQDDFAAASNRPTDSFFGKLQANAPYQWRSATPARFYYGAADEVVTPYIATLPAAYQDIIGGANATAVFAGEDADHRGTFVFGIKDQKGWFDSLRK